MPSIFGGGRVASVLLSSSGFGDYRGACDRAPILIDQPPYYGYLRLLLSPGS